MPFPNRKPNLYALLVGINDYHPPVSPLKGCVNDIEKIASYLQKEKQRFEVGIIKLIDKEATKEAIVAQFKNHLGKASAGDVALFYFSGHGTQEEASPVFWPMESDRKHEALVCFDSYTIYEGKAKFNLLADKEMRYLIHLIAQKEAHILTVFDCCHAGGNTRNSYISQQEGEVRERRFINRKRLSQSFPARDWEDFIFSEAIPFEDTRNQSILNLLPEGNHIQLAACQNDQSAFEVNGEGVFTKSLLEVLNRCEGAITYFDLQSRIQQYLKNQFDQRLKIYVVGEEESHLFQGFLQNKTVGKPLYGNINYNDTLGWIMDLGAMHGISPQSANLKVFTLDNHQEFKATIHDVSSTYTQIRFEDHIDTNSTLKGYPIDYFSHPLGLFLDLQDEKIKDNLIQIIFGGNQNLHRVKKPYEADYCLLIKEGQFIISKPGRLFIPVVKPISYSSDNDLYILQNYLNHLAQFEFVKNLHNPNAYLFQKNPVEIKVLKENPQHEEPVLLSQGELLLQFDKRERHQWGGSIRIVLKNTSDRKLFCSLLYLSFNFGVSVKLLKEVVVGLDPNREVWALDGAPIGLVLEEEIQRFNYPESVSHLKLIVSTTDFTTQISRFEMPPLPGPLATGKKGFDLGANAYNPGNIEDWTTHLITVKIKNPDFHSKPNGDT